jgi:Pvc16 N-terminal domain
MASHTAIAAVSRTLRTLLLDRMVTSALITLAPPDVKITGISGARVNLYLMQVIENAALKNQEIPGRIHPAAYGHPPLSLDLRYLMTTYSENDNQEEADLKAQNILGDAMRVMNDFGNRIDELKITRTAAGLLGKPILEQELWMEFERLRVVLHPATLDDITKVWSAVSGTNFRRSAIYEVTVIQIETTAARPRPAPVETRRIVTAQLRRPEILDAYFTPLLPGDPLGERRIRLGDDITIDMQGGRADKLYVKLGTLDPIRVAPQAGGRIRIVVPDTTYPVDLDHPAARPIPLAQQLQAGTLQVQIVAEHPAEGVEGGLGPGAAISGTKRYGSNLALLQVCPRITSVVPAVASVAAIGAASMLRITGARLWPSGAHSVDVIIGDVAIRVRDKKMEDLWIAPTQTVVEIPLLAVTNALQTSVTPYAVAVEVDGARSRDLGLTFTLGP